MSTPHDVLSHSVPKLETSWKNWPIFAIRFVAAVRAKGVYGHFDGSSAYPKVADETKTTDDESKAIDVWEEDEAQAYYMLQQKIPDSLLIRVATMGNVALRWSFIQMQCTTKSLQTSTAERQSFLNSKCGDKEDVRMFLEKLRERREQLLQSSVIIEDSDYLSTIISSLPVGSEIHRYANQHLTAMQHHARKMLQIHHAKGETLTAAVIEVIQRIDPEELINEISEEHDRLKLFQSTKKSTGRSGGGGGEHDEAMAAQSTNWRNRTPNPARPRGLCWNCFQPGHLQGDCKNPKASPPAVVETSKSASNGKSNEKETANAAASGNDGEDSDGAWSACSCEPSEEVDVNADWFFEEELDGTETVSRSTVAELAVANASDARKKGEERSCAAAAIDDSSPSNERVDLYDSGCSRHISPYRDDFDSFEEMSPKSFIAANRNEFVAEGRGKMMISVPNGEKSTILTLTDVWYSPSVSQTLISNSRLAQSGISSAFDSSKCVLRDRSGIIVGSIPVTRGGLYRVTRTVAEAAKSAESAENPPKTTKDPPIVISADELHRRLGHIAPEAAARLVRDGFVDGVVIDQDVPIPEFCEVCVRAKKFRKPVAKVATRERASEFAERVHSDVWGPAPQETLGHKRYFVTFIDDSTRYTRLYLLQRKNGVTPSYGHHAAWCKTQHGKQVKTLQSDRGGEYSAKSLLKRLDDDGTLSERNVHDTPEHNGVAERMNRTLAERLRGLIYDTSPRLPFSLWGEALRHAVWIQNRVATSALKGMSPYEALYSKKPDLSKLRRFGEYVWVHDPNGSKLEPRACRRRWLGFDDISSGHQIYWEESRSVAVERSVSFETRDAELEGEIDGFVKPAPPDFKFEEQAEVDDNENEDAPDAVVDEPSQDTPLAQPAPAPVPPQPPPVPVPALVEQPTRRSSRARKPAEAIRRLQRGEGSTTGRIMDLEKGALPRGMQAPSRTVTMEEVFEEDVGREGEHEEEIGETEYGMLAENMDPEELDPQSIEECRRRSDWPLWDIAILEELDTLKKAGTYVEVEKPNGVNVVGCKWVFRIKRDADGNIVRRKARLVAQGFSQVPGVDYFDTYAPVAKLASIRAILAIAARLDLELHQVDIKGAYLNGELGPEEVIYMKHPPGIKPPNIFTVLRLIKTLYGLKQSGRRWYQKFKEILFKLGFRQCDVDQAVFYRLDDKKGFMVLAVHVDDCTLAAKSLEVIAAFKKELSEHVEVTDLGELHWLLGMEIKRDRDARTLHISQKSYIEGILRRYGMDDHKPLSTPMDPNVHLSTSQCPTTPADIALMRDVDYRGMLGALMYAALGTRPDIAYAVSTLSRFSTNPGPAHLNAVKRVFRYLAGTKSLWLTYGGVSDSDDGGLKGYADADGSMAEDRRAISGYAFIIDGGAVSWSSKRQEIVSLSTTESEYVAAAHGAKEALWLRQFIGQIFSPFTNPTTLFCDNQSAIALTKDYQYHARTKHIDIRFHFLRWITEKGDIRLLYCPTADMVADSLTKALPSTKVKHFAVELGLRPA